MSQCRFSETPFVCSFSQTHVYRASNHKIGSGLSQLLRISAGQSIVNISEGLFLNLHLFLSEHANSHATNDFISDARVR